jgi:hypothetical protein
VLCGTTVCRSRWGSTQQRFCMKRVPPARLFLRRYAMDVIYSRCCGLDVHKKTVVACLITSTPGQPPQKEVRTFRTMTIELLALADWLHTAACTHVAMESTGVYTPPGILPKRYWSGSMALRLRVPACSSIRKSSFTPCLPTPYRPTKAPVRRVQEYRMAKPSSQRRTPPEVTIMFEPHRLQHDLLQAVYTLLVPLPRRRLTAKPVCSVPSRVQPHQGRERRVS